ncbi:MULTISPECIES: nitrogenase component 1 [Methylosinus]|nr:MULTISPECIES: nitrogenase component 1 [Methylosinus]
MVPLDHGPVGCGAYGQTMRLTAPGYVQGIESFSALHACTDLRAEDIGDAGDRRLARAIDEIAELFPLARGIVVASEEPMPALGADITGIAKAKMAEQRKLILPLNGYRSWAVETAAALRSAELLHPLTTSSGKRVVLPYSREATALVWIVSKLLMEIGLEPVHEMTQSSAIDLARVSDCKLVIGFASKVGALEEQLRGGYADLLQRWFATPIVWTCFESPSTTSASLRAIAKRFDRGVARRVDAAIVKGEALVAHTIDRYRPRLEGKLVLFFRPMTEAQLEPYRLLGLRIGDASGWTGKTGKQRTPRLKCDDDHPDERAIDSYISEAKPDLVLHFGNGETRGEYEWRKRGQVALPFSPFFDRKGNAFWGYDGFACLAAALDRAMNATWRDLVQPPW